MDADAVDDAPRLRRFAIALDHQVLDCHCAFDGGDDGGKLEQQTVAHGLDEPAAEIRNDRAAARDAPAPPLLYPPHPRSSAGNSRQRRRP